MRWLTGLENRLHGVAFPGLFKYLTLLGVIVFALQWIDPSVLERLVFNREKIFSGEVWRIFSFIFTPAGVFPFTAFGALFLFFAVMISFLINDSLEEVWGSTRTTLYLLTAIIGLILGQFLFNPPPLPVGRYIYTSMFLAFATYFPNYEFRLFFILPVKVRYLGWIALGLMILSALAAPILLCIVVPTLIPYALWVLPTELRSRAELAQAAKRRQKFASATGSGAEPFHHCEVCHRSEQDDPDLEFRCMTDGTEYCLEHLPEEASDS